MPYSAQKGRGFEGGSMTYGVCFEPYVGPWDGSQPVLFNAYSLDQVERMLYAVSKKFARIRTYGQGTFVWEGTPKIQDSNKYNIQAASTAGLKVSAGCYQQGANPGGDSINVAWTQTEIDYAIEQAYAYGNVDELIIGNESIWGPNSAGDITALLKYAKKKRTSEGFSATSLPVTTCQQWGVLAGVNNQQPSFEPTRKALIAMLEECENRVYANIYPYFDPTIATKIGQNPTEDHFQKVTKASYDGSLNALQTAFSDASVGLTIAIGETGWPTQGWQPTEPNPIGTVQYAQWYYDAVKSWSGTDIYYFEAFNEPWKGNESGTSSEAYFGLWTSEGTSSEPGQYTMTKITEIITV
jgi:exo-beta-1,3-glucanase (GH17 family)